MKRFFLDARTATPHFPGIGRYVRNLAAALIPLLAEDQRLTLLWDPSTPGGWDPKGLASDRVQRLPAPVSPFGLAQQWQIPRILRQLPASAQDSIYHSPYYLMPYRTGLPTVLTFYDLISLRYPEYVSPQARLFFRLATQMALWPAQRVVAISQSARRDLLHYFSIPADRVEVTPLAPDPRFQPQSQAEIARIREQYNLPSLFLLYLGINKPHKNLLTLLEAYAPLATPNFPLVIAGAWDSRYPQSKERVTALGLEKSVHFLGQVDDADLPGLYAAAALFVFPSRYEGFGLPVLEAMACATPVLCSNSSSLPEIVEDAALTFDPGDRVAMQAVLDRAMQDSALRAQLSQWGVARAQTFSWAATAAQTLDVYHSLRR